MYFVISKRKGRAGKISLMGVRAMQTRDRSLVDEDVKSQSGMFAEQMVLTEKQANELLENLAWKIELWRREKVI